VRGNDCGLISGTVTAFGWKGNENPVRKVDPETKFESREVTMRNSEFVCAIVCCQNSLIKCERAGL
jgi:hypothetical protein